jgi:hypothetical protein
VFVSNKGILRDAMFSFVPILRSTPNDFKKFQVEITSSKDGATYIAPIQEFYEKKT